MNSKWLALPVAALLALSPGASAAFAANAIANGGFEDTTPIRPPPIGGVTSFANHWRSAPTGFPVVLSPIARTGQYAALLSVPTGFGGSTMFQNSVADGGLPPLVPGDAPVLTSWAKGDVGVTGNIPFALRYLEVNGIIGCTSGNQLFQNSISAASWTQIMFAAPEFRRRPMRRSSRSTRPSDPSSRTARTRCSWTTSSSAHRERPGAGQQQHVGPARAPLALRRGA